MSDRGTRTKTRESGIGGLWLLVVGRAVSFAAPKYVEWALLRGFAVRVQARVGGSNADSAKE